MRTSLLRGRRYSAISSKLLLSGVFFVSFFGAIGYFSLDAPARANSLTAPSNPTPVSGGVVNGRSYVQTWSAVPGAAKYEYKSYNDANGLSPRVTIFYNTAVKQTDNIPDNTIYWWKVRAVDATGAVGPWSPLWKTTTDNVAPAVALTASTPAGTPDLYNTPVTIAGTVNAAEKNLASHTFTITNPQGVVSTIGPINTASFAHSFTLDTSAGDGQYTIAYSALDKAGNKSAVVTRTVVVDTTAPDAPVLFGDSARTMQPGDATHTWAPSAAADVKNYIFKSFSSAADAAAPDTSAALVTETLVPNQTSVTRATGATDGTYWYRVAAVDNAGNSAWSSETFMVTIDNTPPAKPSIAIEDFVAGGVTNKTTHTVNWQTASADATRYVFRYGLEGTAPTELNTTTTQWQGAFEAGDGVYVVQVRAIDAVGNESEWSDPAKLRIDSAAPGIALTELSPMVAPAAATLTGTVDDDTITEVAITLNGTTHGTATVTNGTFSYSLSGLTAKTYTIGVSATDEAGNTGEAATGLLVNAPPVVAPPVTPANPVTSPAPAAATPAPTGRTAVLAPAAETAPADDEAGEVFEATTVQDRSAIESDATEAGQETKGATDSKVTGDGFMSWLGWIVALLLALGWFWWMVAARRRRKDEE